MPKSLRIILPIAVVLVIAGGIGLWDYHDEPQFCATCHIMEPYLESWESSALLAHSHSEYDIACLDCHESNIEQQVNEVVKFVTGDYETPLAKRKVSKDNCLACHEHESYEQLIEFTSDLEETVGANPHNSHWGEMECRLCHSMHRDSTDYCSECHQWGWDVP